MSGSLLMAAVTLAADLKSDLVLGTGSGASGIQQSKDLGSSLVGGSTGAFANYLWVNGQGVTYPVSFEVDTKPTFVTSVGGGTIAAGSEENAQESTIAYSVPCVTGPFSGRVQYEASAAGGSIETGTAWVDISGTVTSLGSTCGAPDTSPPTNASIVINDAAIWTNAVNVIVDISATDNVGVSRYRLAETQLGLDGATDVAVSPAETAFSRTDVLFSLTGADHNAKAVWLRVCDAASNCSDTSDTIGLDRVAPTSVVDGFPDGAVFYLGDILPIPSCLDGDDRSGVSAGGTLTGPSGTGPSNPNGVGSFVYSCNGAVDNAGNTQTTADGKTFWVHYAGLSGILQPINPDNSSVFSRGKAVPVKFKVDGDEFTGFDFSGWTLRQQQVSCTSFGDEGTAAEPVSENPSNSFRYDSVADQYVYNANFKDKTAGTCWKVVVTLDSGQIMSSAVFKLQK